VPGLPAMWGHGLPGASPTGPLTPARYAVPAWDSGDSAGAPGPWAGYARSAISDRTFVSFTDTLAVPLQCDLSPRDFHARLSRCARGVGARRRGRHLGRRGLVLAAVAVPAIAAAQDWSGFGSSTMAAPAAAHAGVAAPARGPAAGWTLFDLARGDAARPIDPDAYWDDGRPGQALPVGPAARALRAGGTALDQMRALTCLTQAVYYEAASEPDGGQRAVAQVVLNRVAHPAYPKTVCGVVYQGSERSTGCQFTFTCDGALARMPNRLAWERAESVARAALAGYVYAPVGLATHYHTYAVHPYWAGTLNYIGQIGAHLFYRFGGPAGSSALFNPTVYRGGEPVAAPPPRGAPSGLAAPDPVAIERAYADGLRAAAMATPAALASRAPAPAYAPALEPRGGDALYTARALPGAASGSGSVRPEYANAGQWIARPGS